MPRSTPRYLELVLLSAAVAVALAGCFLEPRRPAPGGGEECFAALPATDDFEELFVNLEGSLGCLQQSTYLDFIHPDFEFFPSAVAVSSFPAVFANPWGFDEEQRWFGDLASETESLVANLRLEDILINVEGSQGTVEAVYELRFVPRGGGEIVYRGEALYTIEVSGTKWVLRSWDDRDAGGVDPPAGNLRGTNLN